MILVTGAGGFVGNKIMQLCDDTLACPSLRGVSEDTIKRIVEESSVDIKKRVDRAREVQLNRFKDTGIYHNSKMTDQQLKEYCKLSSESDIILRHAFDKLKLSARAYNRILKVARTIADMDGCESITEDHIMEAISYRTLDKKYWD